MGGHVPPGAGSRGRQNKKVDKYVNQILKNICFNFFLNYGILINILAILTVPYLYLGTNSKTYTVNTPLKYANTPYIYCLDHVCILLGTILLSKIAQWMNISIAD